MLKFGPWDLPGFDYFESKNTYIGSKDKLRFKLTPKEEDFKLEIWFGEKCYDLSTVEIEEHFPLEEASIYKINDFLSAKLKESKAE